MNHLLTPDDLVCAFRAAARALEPGGLFIFDINTAEAYESEWGKSAAVVDDDAALFVRGRYDERSHLGTTMITMFRREGVWARNDLQIVQRCYDDREACDALRAAGFARIESRAAVDAGVTGDIAVGRRFYRCTLG
jgi:hypothetical protein